MGDDGNVMRLLLDMLMYLEERPDSIAANGARAENNNDKPSTPNDLDNSDHAAPAAAPATSPAAAAAAAAPDSDEEGVEEEEPPQQRPPPAPRRQATPRWRRLERRRVLRLATQKLGAQEENERCLRWEKDLRQQTLLQNMAARLEAEACADRATRAASRSRAARCRSRAVGSASERRRRRREAPTTSTSTTATTADSGRQEVDVHEMFSDIYHQPTPALLIGPLDEDDVCEVTPAGHKRCADEATSPLAKRLRPLPDVENADPNRGTVAQAEAPQEQVRLDDEPASPPRGCAASVGFSDFQHVFHQLVPSLES